MRKALIELKNITKTFEDGNTVLDDFSLRINENEFITLCELAGADDFLRYKKPEIDKAEVKAALKRGDVIGYVGIKPRTGISVLLFSIRSNGDYKDPMTYFK